MNFNQIIQKFQAEILAKGIMPPQEILADGQLHRFYVKGDKQGSRNGWYILFNSNVPCGVFGSWKEGITYKWCAKKRSSMNNREYIAYKRLDEAKYRQEAERAKVQEEAAKHAERIYLSCSKADPNHPYLVRKSITPFYARQRGSYLYLPIIDFEGNYWSLQRIGPMKVNGRDKSFLPDGAITGHFIPIQHKPTGDREILICEGFATGATLAQVFPNACVLAACDAGNLKPVAVDIRQHLPRAKMIVCADIDNVGLTKAKEASIAANALLRTPKFPPGTSNKLNDWNDLFCLVSSGGIQL